MNYRNRHGLAVLTVVAHLLMGASTVRADDSATGQNAISPTVAAALEAATVATQKGDFKQAAAQYTKALELEPKNAPTWLARGEAQRHLGQYEKALLDYKQAIQLDATLTSQFAQGVGADRVRAENQSFLLSIEDVFSITGRGVAVTGPVARGQVKVGDVVEVVGLRAAQKATIAELQSKRKSVAQVGAGEDCLLLLRSVGQKDIERGQTLIALGSAIPATEFEAQLYLLTSEQGGRKTPFFRNYRPQFFLRTVDVTGTVLEVGGEAGVATPGDIVNVKVNLLTPVVLEEGLRFALREGGRVVGIGVVTKLKSTVTP